jgi:hypothetical protein
MSADVSPSSGSRDAAIRASARTVLDENWRAGYTLPSARLYPFQWNWDSGFIALGLGLYRPQRAIEEIRSMFKGLWANGMLPHIVFHKSDANYFPGPDVWKTERAAGAPATVPTSGITQPPVFAFVVERLASLPLGTTPEWRDFEREIYPRLLAFHRYLYTQRDPHREGLVYIQHPWESGTDNSPIWDDILRSIDLGVTPAVAGRRRDIHNVDPSHRPTNADYQRYLHLVDLFVHYNYDDAAIAAGSPFLVQDVLFNSLLARSNVALIALANRLGEDSAEIESWNAKARAAFRDKLWDAETGFYYAYDLRNERPIRIRTCSGLMPLFAGLCTTAQAGTLAGHMIKSFTRNEKWRLCASTAVDHAAFDPRKYWRGPVWLNTNWMLVHGLSRYGHVALAERVKRDSLELYDKVGPYEYFDPRPESEAGEAGGLGADRFSWSAALALDLLDNPAPL